MPNKTSNDTVRLGISGLGSFAVMLANTLKRSMKIELVSCYSRSPGNRAAFSSRYGCAQANSYEEMVKRDDLDGVLLVTPNAIHRKQTEIAAAHGKHVFVEKPIANTMEDGIKMIQVCKAASVVLMVGHVNRRHAANRKIKALIDRGAIGDSVMVEANQSSGQGWDLTPDEFRWRGDDLGCPAGPLMTMGVHQADTFNYIFGAVKSVFSVFRKRHIPAPVEDVTATMLEFESGLVGYLGSNYASPKSMWMRVYGTEANLIRTTVTVDKRFDAERRRSIDQSARLEIIGKGQAESKEVSFTVGDPILEELDEFADCIMTGHAPETDGLAGLTALALVRAAIESARTRKPVDISDMMGLPLK